MSRRRIRPAEVRRAIARIDPVIVDNLLLTPAQRSARAAAVVETREPIDRDTARARRACLHVEADRRMECTPDNVYVWCRACGACLQA